MNYLPVLEVQILLKFSSLFCSENFLPRDVPLHSDAEQFCVFPVFSKLFLFLEIESLVFFFKSWKKVAW